VKAKQREALENLSLDELKSQLRENKEKRMKLLFKHRTAPLSNPLELRELRRHIARLETHVNTRAKAEPAKATSEKK
jgi:large subunit ribosomal protein L29